MFKSKKAHGAFVDMCINMVEYQADEVNVYEKDKFFVM